MALKNPHMGQQVGREVYKLPKACCAAWGMYQQSQDSLWMLLCAYSLQNQHRDCWKKWKPPKNAPMASKLQGFQGNSEGPSRGRKEEI